MAAGRGMLTATLVSDKVRVRRVAAAARVTRWLQGRDRLDGRAVTVAEFPKSGGTWLARMIATALEWPFLDNWTWVPGNDCVLRGHQLPGPRPADHVYMARDPRDVYISLFHHRARHWESNERYRLAWLDVHGEPLDPSRTREQLADFLRFEQDFVGRPGSAVDASWSGHVRAWLDTVSTEGRAVPVVTYEALRADPESELRRIVTEVVGDPGAEITAAAVAAHRFDLRKQVQFTTGSRSFLRSGGAGGWRETFTAPAGELLHELHGAEMARLGYIASEGWVDELPRR